MSFHDFEQMNKKIEELTFENQLLKTVIDYVNEGIYAVDKDGTVILYNTMVEQAEQMHRANVLGRNEKEVYAFVRGDYFDKIVTEKVLSTKQPVKGVHYRYNTPSAHEKNIIVNSYPFFYNGEVAAVFSLGHDQKQMKDFADYIYAIQKQLSNRDKDIRYENSSHYLFSDIIGRSAKIKDAVDLAQKIAKHDSSVLIIGETGTGKELFAQGIHNASEFSKGPFIPINCAAIPDTLLESILFGTVKGAFTGSMNVPGLFEQADNGTIFLDEINSMAYPFQSKLLRAIQEKTIRRVGSQKEIPLNCRIVSATNIDPYADRGGETIRPDLLFRLSVTIINLPPLRERDKDIEYLAHHFIEKLNKRFLLNVDDLSNETKGLFLRYPWPGNIRELENVIESAMNFMGESDTEIELKHIPEYFRERMERASFQFSGGNENRKTLRQSMLDYERSLISDALVKNNWNVTRAAQDLGMLRQNLHHKINQYGLKRL